MPDIVLDLLESFNYHSISHNEDISILYMRKTMVSKLRKFALPLNTHKWQKSKRKIIFWKHWYPIVVNAIVNICLYFS